MKMIFRVVGLVMTALLLGACASAPPTENPNKRDTPLGEETAVLALVNQLRASGSCAGETFPVADALTWNSSLFDAAIEHAQTMVAAGTTIETEAALTALLNKHGYEAEKAAYVVNGVATTNPNAETAQAGLLVNGASCQTIMDPALTELGAGYWPGASQVFWATLIAQPKSQEANQAFLGTWKGQVSEQGFGTYDLELKLDKLAVGEVAGTSIYSNGSSCEGEIKLLSLSNGKHLFSETITSDPNNEGCANGVFELSEAGTNQLAWSWYSNQGVIGSTPQATATLSKNQGPVEQCPVGETREGDVILKTQADVDALQNVSKINGSLKYESSLDLNLTALKGLKEISKELDFYEPNGTSRQTKITGFDCLEKVGENIRITRNPFLTEISVFESLKEVGGSLWIEENDALTALPEFANLETLSSIEINENKLLTSLPSFPTLKSIGKLEILENTTLKTISGFLALQSVGRFDITENPALETIDAFDELTTVTDFFSITLGNSADLKIICPSFQKMTDTTKRPACTDGTTPTPEASLTVSPTTASVTIGDTTAVPFTATLTNAPDTINWTVTAGSLSSTTGTTVSYTAPATGEAGTATLTATAGALTATATITLNAATPPPPSEAEKALELVNAARATGACGLPAAPPLSLNTTLNEGAQAYAADFGTDFKKAVVDAGYLLKAFGAGAGGGSSIQDFINTQLADPARCADLLNPELKELGIGVAPRTGFTAYAYIVANRYEPRTDLTNMANDMLAAINAARAGTHFCKKTQASYGPVPAISLNDLLNIASQRHSNDMKANDFFSHTGSDGSSPSSRAADAGYTGSVSENLSAGADTERGAVESWLNSTDLHCETVMKADATEMGIGYAFDYNSSRKTYWTLLVGNP